MLRPALAISIVMGAALLAPSSPALAQTSQARAAVILSAGYNSLSTPLGFPTTTSSQGPFSSVALTLGDAINTQRTTHTLTYHFGLVLPISQSFQFTQNPVRYTNAARYNGRYELTPTVDGLFGLGVTQAPINTFNPALGPAASQITALPAGYSDIVNGDVRGGFQKQVGKKQTVVLLENFSAKFPIDTNPIQARVFRSTTTLSHRYDFSLDNLRTVLSGSYNYIGISETSTGVVYPTKVGLNHLTEAWTHTITPQWSTIVRGGVTNIITPTTQGTVFFDPTFGAQVRYNPQIGKASLTYNHAGTINVYTSQLTQVDALSLRGALPLGSTNLYTIGALGFSHTSSLTPQGNVVPTDVWLANGGITYRPARIPKLGLTATYAIRQQNQPLNPANGTFTHQTILFSITYAYPNALFALQDAEIPEDEIEDTGITSDLTGETAPGLETPEAPPEESEEPEGLPENAKPSGATAPAPAPPPAPP